MHDFFFGWAGWIALGCGAVSGFGILRSEKLVFWLALSAAAAQIVFGTVLFVLFRAPKDDIGIVLMGGYFFALLAALPYTTIGAVIAAAIVNSVRVFIRALGRRTVEPEVADASKWTSRLDRLRRR